MTIEKGTHKGWYLATNKIGGEWFVGSGKSHTEAMEDCFSNIAWKYEHAR